MSPETQALVRIAAALASEGDVIAESLEDALMNARTAARPSAIREMLLQSVLFVGYPKVLNAFLTWRGESAAADARSAADRLADAGDRVDAAASEAAPAQNAPAEWARRGRDVLARVYGDQHEQVVRNVEALDADLAQWMVVDGYGKVLGRPGLPLDVRELCIVAMLVRQDAARQLYSHLRGALNAGAAVADIEETLGISTSGMSATRSARAMEVWQTVRSRRGE